MGLLKHDNNEKFPKQHNDPESVVATVKEEPMDILRCAPMSLLQLYIPMEAAQATVAELGNIGLVQFRDVIILCACFCFNIFI